MYVVTTATVRTCARTYMCVREPSYARMTYGIAVCVGGGGWGVGCGGRPTCPTTILFGDNGCTCVGVLVPDCGESSQVCA